MDHQYVHGYSARETQRLREQSLIIAELLHGDTRYPAGSRVLEAGCGVGAQTALLAVYSPQAAITSIDISPGSLGEARRLIREQGYSNVSFSAADIRELPFPAAAFDHIFVCFVLEHLADPRQALISLRKVLKPGGTLTVIEGDHVSFLWHPLSLESQQVWQCLITLQQQLGHDPLIGRRLYPLISGAGFEVRSVAPRWLYTDAGTPELKTSALHQIMIPMLQASRSRALEQKLIDAATWDRGIADFTRAAASPEGTFFYTWFKAAAVKPDGPEKD